MKSHIKSVKKLNIKDTKRKGKFLWMRLLWNWRKNKQKTILVVVLLLALIYMLVAIAPGRFPIGTIVTVEEGTTLNEVVDQFEDQKIIKSKLLFKALLVLQVGQDGVKAGDYFFAYPKDVFRVSRTIAVGDYGLTPLSITVPEGATVVEMALIYEKHLGGFNAERFVDLALPFEGFLFPDTYFFLPNVKEDDIVDAMKDNFVKKIAEVQEEIDAFGKPLEDVIIMASLIEEEARKFETRRMIAGILWNRIDIGMLLQVDAVFPYIIGKNTFEVSLDDLAFDSPYNTYKYPGLPHGPISNPGISSILATVTPRDSDYIFYLSDYDGNMHYARTFEQHKRNKNIYLR